MKIDNWESIGEREKLAETRIFSVYKQKKRSLISNKVSSFATVDAPDWVVCIPTYQKDGETYVIMVRQYRYGSASITLEFPCGTVEKGEEYKDTALREVKEETGANATIIKYVGKSRYSFTVPEDTVEKEVHWYLMMGESYYSKPQREEYFVDSGFYKYHEAYHLLKFANEKQILEKAYNEYLDLKRSNLWGNHKYF